MRWRDIRFEKPTEADGDIYGEVATIGDRGRKGATSWDSVDLPDYCFWCPLSELPDPPDRIPDPPEGWTWADTSKPIDTRARFWHRSKQFWCDLFIDHCYAEGEAYIVPIDPPVPEGYRKAVAGDEGRKDCMIWKSGGYVKRWRDDQNGSETCPFCIGEHYIVPIDPPAPPTGYELATGDGPHDGLIFFCPIDKQWKPVLRVDGVRKIDPGWYAVPVKPQYRPFANAAEFDIWAFKFWRYKDDLRSVRRPPMSYSDDGHYGDKWDVSFIRKEFADGTPFGIRIDHAD
jgi:hypothetical protein